MIDRPLCGLDDKAAGISRVDQVAVLGHRGAVQSLRQEEFTEWEDVIAADVHGMHIRNPLACKVSDEFRRADDSCPGAPSNCLLYTSDAADDLLCVDLGGRRIIKKKKTQRNQK